MKDPPNVSQHLVSCATIGLPCFEGFSLDFSSPKQEKVPEKILPTASKSLCGVDLESLERFVNEHLLSELSAEWIGGQLCIAVDVLHVGQGASSTVTVTTAKDHNFYKYDRISFDSVQGESMGILLNGRQYTVLNIENGQRFQIDLCEVHDDISDKTIPDARHGRVWTPVNMYKASPEFVIPCTIIEERLVHVASKKCLQALHEAMHDGVEDAKQNLTLKREVSLPDARGNIRVLSRGLTVHGRLSERGHVRRRYWAHGEARILKWRTTRQHGRSQRNADALPPTMGAMGEMEAHLSSLDNIGVGDTVVLRRGVSYAELLDCGSAQDFVSHWWGEPCSDLLKTLQKHTQDVVEDRSLQGLRRKWICTLCVRQHCVDLGDGWDAWQSFIFNLTLLHIKAIQGSVIVALDESATPLKRIWCIFEAWVCACNEIPYLLYSADGDVETCLESSVQEVQKRAQVLQAKVAKLDIRDAAASRDEDRHNILQLIERGEGGVDQVEYLIKRNILDTSDVVVSLQRIQDPLTGQQLSIEGANADVLPAQLVLSALSHRWWNLFRPQKQPRRAQCFSSLEMYDMLLNQNRIGAIVSGEAGSGKSVLAVELARKVAEAVRVPIAHLHPLVKEWLQEHPPQIHEIVKLTADSARARLCCCSNTCWCGCFKAASSASVLDTLFSNSQVHPEAPLQKWSKARFGEKGFELFQPRNASGILLVLDGLDQGGDSCIEFVLWLRRWIRYRRLQGWADRVVLTTRPEVMLRESWWLDMLPFNVYDLLPRSQADASQIIRRVVKSVGMLSRDCQGRLFIEHKSDASEFLLGLGEELYSSPLMATLAAHYYMNETSSITPSMSIASHAITHWPSVRSPTPRVQLDRAAILGFVRKEFVNQATKKFRAAKALAIEFEDTSRQTNRLRELDGHACLDGLFLQLAWNATAVEKNYVSGVGSMLLVKIIDAWVGLMGLPTVPRLAFWKSESRLLSKDHLTWLSQDMGPWIFRAGRRGELRLLEPGGDGDSIQFAHVIVQEHFAANYIHEGSRDLEVFKAAWYSLSAVCTSRFDGLDSVRDCLCALLLEDATPAYGAIATNLRLRMAARSGHLLAVQCILEGCLEWWEIGDALEVAAACLTLGKAFDVLRILSEHANALDLIFASSISFFRAATVLGAPALLASGAVCVASWNKFCMIMLFVCAAVSLVLNVTAGYHPLRFLLFVRVWISWIASGWSNALLLPLSLLGLGVGIAISTVLAILMALPCCCWAPFSVDTLQRVHKHAPFLMCTSLIVSVFASLAVLSIKIADHSR